MYSGLLVYQSSCWRTSGVSSGSMEKPTRMRCHRSGSGMGTSSGSSKGSGSAAGLEAEAEAATGVAEGGWAGAVAARATHGRPRASPPANVRRYRFRSDKLVLVSAGLFHPNPQRRAGQRQLQSQREVAHRSEEHTSELQS